MTQIAIVDVVNRSGLSHHKAADMHARATVGMVILIIAAASSWLVMHLECPHKAGKDYILCVFFVLYLLTLDILVANSIHV